MLNAFQKFRYEDSVGNPVFCTKLSDFIKTFKQIQNNRYWRKGENIMLKPLGDRIVIKVIEDTEQTSGGIFIPDSAKEKPQKGEVVAVGQGKMNEKGEREPMDVKVGETVLYAKYAGTDIKMDGVEYKILSVKDALAVIE